MNPLLLLVLGALIVLQLALPRRWAALPLLLAAVHTPPICQIGGFSCARIIIVVGVARALASGLLELRQLNALDKLMIAFSAIMMISALGHDWIFGNPFVFRIGLLLNIVGTYLYARAYLTGVEAMETLQRCLLVALIPFAMLMAFERTTGKNPYSAIGAKRDVTLFRMGKNRAQGPFGTPILAGTVGASAVPILLPLWRRRRLATVAGLGASATIILASASSGPISTMLVAGGLIGLWYVREHMKLILIGTALGLVMLHFIKERPVWYLMALMDFVGGSTGWHRAYLIDVGMERIGEWWLVGTDYTGHWMPYSLGTNVPGIAKADLTNYYLHLGVIAGLPLVLCLFCIQWNCFRRISTALRHSAGSPNEFELWCIGAAMGAHAVTFLSISYYDQMFVFFWLLVGMVSTIPGTDFCHDEEESPCDEPPSTDGQTRFGMLDPAVAGHRAITGTDWNRQADVP
jgi:hypothetical protein